MPRLTLVRTSILAIALGALVVSGIQLSAASAARAPHRSGPPMQGPVPYGYGDQDGSGIVFKGIRVREDGTIESARLQNVTTERVVAVHFVAAVEAIGRGARGVVQLFTSNEIPVSIGPNETANVTADVLSAAQIERVARQSGTGRVQVFYSLLAASFGNGAEWHANSNREARSGSEGVGIPVPRYPRALIERDAAKPIVAYGACADDRGRATSHGGVMEILNEPGHFMRCADGRWVETAVR